MLKWSGHLPIILLCSATTLTSCNSGKKVAKGSTEMHTETEWQVTPSFKYDVLCFLNSLTGDEYYHLLFCVFIFLRPRMSHWMIC